ncbi:MAG TPA: hypothetical protein VLA04_01550 [Verrucomicrobiae bacterium]|nr:hypothetical protein [Verrucomicrobiae bacterium]
MLVPEEYIALPKTGVVNYWLDGSQEAGSEPYPNDLDDTAICIGLRARQGLLTPHEKAGYVRTLIAAETAPGGPYATWCTSDPAWHDVDPVVNANIAWSLAQCGVTLPPLSAYLQEMWEKDAVSPYYANRWVTRYLLLRSLTQPQSAQKVLKKRLASSPPSGVLECAAAKLCQKACGLPIKSERVQKIDWEPLVMERRGKNPRLAGSELATALWVVAANKPEKVAEVALPMSYTRVRLLIEGLPQELATSLLPVLAKIERADQAGSIAGIATVLARQAGFKVSAKELERLEDATVLGWLAYTLADDVLDGDSSSQALPSIQWATRQSFRCFIEVAGLGFIPSAEAVFTRMDAANAWEVTHARGLSSIPLSYPPLAERSLGHALGPLALLMICKEAGADQVLVCMEAYLALRQHIDDAHDWLADHEHGIRTTIGDITRSHAGGKTVSDLRQSFRLHTAGYVMDQGALYVAALNSARCSLPPKLKFFLEKEEARLTRALERFSETLQFTEALRLTA